MARTRGEHQDTNSSPAAPADAALRVGLACALSDPSQPVPTVCLDYDMSEMARPQAGGQAGSLDIQAQLTRGLSCSLPPLRPRRTGPSARPRPLVMLEGKEGIPLLC